MLIACIIVVAIFIIFVTTTFFLTRKSYTFEFEGKKIKVANSGSVLSIFIDDILFQGYHLPQLVRGETFKVNVGEKEIFVHCKTNFFGNKFSIKASFDGKEIYNNGVKVK